MYKIVTVLLFVSRLLFVNLQSCHSVNFDVYHRETESIADWSNWNTTRVKGCINDESFYSKSVSHIFITGHVLFRLEENFISDMMHLREIFLEKSNIVTMAPGAFSNLPQLQKIFFNDHPIQSIPKGVFNTLPSLQHLNIHTNKLLSNIEDGVFANMPNLVRISLSQNNLDYMKREWFTNTSNIEYFNMFRNSVRKIPAGMFHGWKRLTSIILNSNAISEIEGELLKDNPLVMSAIGLHHNRLTSIAPNTFSNKVYVSYLSLSGNLLNYLPEEFLTNILVDKIAIFANPFSCPCLEKINRIFSKRFVTVDDPISTYATHCKDGGVPICGYSTTFSRTCVEAVDKNVTELVISYMKKIRYDTVRDPSGQQCAMFDHLD